MGEKQQVVRHYYVPTAFRPGITPIGYHKKTMKHHCTYILCDFVIDLRHHLIKLALHIGKAGIGESLDLLPDPSYRNSGDISLADELYGILCFMKIEYPIVQRVRSTWNKEGKGTDLVNSLLTPKCGLIFFVRCRVLPIRLGYRLLIGLGLHRKQRFRLITFHLCTVRFHAGHGEGERITRLAV